jgi:hypothetical protein
VRRALLRPALWRGALGAALVACSTANPASMTPEGAPEPTSRLSDVTVLPPSFAKALPPEDGGLATVPAFMLMVSAVARPKAELRAGPGPQYELADSLLPQRTPVLLYTRFGVWQKVVVLGTWQRGWVHAGALGPAAPNPRRLVVDLRRLPTVIVAHDVETVQAFRSLAPLHAAIPRGAQFRSLRIADGGTLVWLPQTNSTMWLSRKDVQ